MASKRGPALVKRPSSPPQMNRSWAACAGRTLPEAGASRKVPPASRICVEQIQDRARCQAYAAESGCMLHPMTSEAFLACTDNQAHPLRALLRGAGVHGGAVHIPLACILHKCETVALHLGVCRAPRQAAPGLMCLATSAAISLQAAMSLSMARVMSARCTTSCTEALTWADSALTMHHCCRAWAA